MCVDASVAFPKTSLAMRNKMNRRVAGLLIALMTVSAAHSDDTVPHAVRAIDAGLLGWYDGNPTTLNPMESRIKARKMASLAGGTDRLTEPMVSTPEKEEFQWGLELSDHVKWLDDANRELAKKTKIKALRGLAAREYNTPNRNDSLTYADELESGELSELWF